MVFMSTITKETKSYFDLTPDASFKHNIISRNYESSIYSDVLRIYFKF